MAQRHVGAAAEGGKDAAQRRIEQRIIGEKRRHDQRGRVHERRIDKDAAQAGTPRLRSPPDQAQPGHGEEQQREQVERGVTEAVADGGPGRAAVAVDPVAKTGHRQQQGAEQGERDQVALGRARGRAE